MKNLLKEEPLWKVADVAAFLSMSESFVYKSAATGDPPCVRIGASLRFAPAVVRSFARGELPVRPKRKSQALRL